MSTSNLQYGTVANSRDRDTMLQAISFNQKISEYGQEIPKSHTVDQGREERKDQESNRSSTTPDLGHHVGK